MEDLTDIVAANAAEAKVLPKDLIANDWSKLTKPAAVV